MTLVVDASVAIRWYIEAPGTSEAISLLDSEGPFVSPGLVIAEVTNVAWKLVRAGQISREHGSRIALALPSAFSKLVGSASLASRAFEISLQLDHPVYDCQYLALAESEQSKLATTDNRLARAVKGTDWEPLVQVLARD